MITRAYQNAKGERQEVAMSMGEWETLTVDQLQSILGFRVESPKPAPVPAAPRAPASSVKRKARAR